ncbi:MAG: hypothetical protein HUJ54_13910 [Erysipelotrichaceae bacterium]|nr:hypothetical protein [Erysipelotrichaceae bacterium]
MATKNNKNNSDTQNQKEKLYRRVNPSPGTHLSESKATPGTYRGMEFDENNKLVGSAEFEEVDPSEYTEVKETRVYVEKKQPQLSPLQERLVDRIADRITQRAIDYSENELIPKAKQFINDIAVPKSQQFINETVIPKSQQFMKEKAIPTFNKGKERIKSSLKNMKAQKQQSNHSKSYLVQALQKQSAEKKEPKPIRMSKKQKTMLEARSLLLKLEAEKSDAVIAQSETFEDNENPNNLPSNLKNPIYGLCEFLLIPENLNIVNQLLNQELNNYKSLIDELSDILGRPLVVNGSYEPIQESEIRKFKQLNHGD